MSGDFPRRLHLGSGKNFLPDWLNVDCSPQWQPDVLHDLEQPFPSDRSVPYRTDRFGDVLVGSNTFDEIRADDLLEHIRALPTLMTSCLDVLRPAGVFRISVPYELSLGAWSDPTHVRAFNERSWVYWCEWSWYFGWAEFRFHLEDLRFTPSELGRDHLEAGTPLEEVLRMPRAVDSMQATLVKVPLTEADLEALRQHSARSRPGPA
ncbi:MAG: hypothetical protein R3F30_14640 [Planctomycetota bacterium]